MPIFIYFVFFFSSFRWMWLCVWIVCECLWFADASAAWFPFHRFIHGIPPHLWDTRNERVAAAASAAKKKILLDESQSSDKCEFKWEQERTSSMAQWMRDWIAASENHDQWLLWQRVRYRHTHNKCERKRASFRRAPSRKKVVIFAIAKSHIPNLHKSHTNRAYALNANAQIISRRVREKLNANITRSVCVWEREKAPNRKLRG